jgi:hypothetical protein
LVHSLAFTIEFCAEERSISPIVLKSEYISKLSA